MRASSEIIPFSPIFDFSKDPPPPPEFKIKAVICNRYREVILPTDGCSLGSDVLGLELHQC